MGKFKPHDIFIEAENNGGVALTAWEFMMRPCRTREELRAWLFHFLNMDPPDTIVDPDSTSTPLEMAWKVYRNCLWYFDIPPEERETKMLFYANRDGFKTLIAAAVEFMVVIHDKRGVVHTAATLKQASKAYEQYFKRFLNEPIFRPFLIGDADLGIPKLIKDTQSQLTLGNHTNIQIIPITKQSVQGQHEPLLVRDEIDVVQDQAAYTDLPGIASEMTDGSGRPPVDLGISVRKSAFGLVQREIEAIDAGAEGKYYHWNIIDCTERCPDSRSGQTPVTLYVRENSMHYVSESQFHAMDPGLKRKFEPKPALQGCIDNCQIFAACLTNLKKQTSTSSWLKPIEFVRSKLKSTEESMFIASYLSRKPPSEGLVFGRFDEKNKKSYAEMYEIFTGDKWKHERMTLDELVAVFKAMDVPCFAGVDWGFTDASTCVVMYVDANDNVYIVYSLWRTQTDNAEFIKIIRDTVHDRFGVSLYYPDSSNPSGIKMMRDEPNELPVSGKVDKTANSIYDGVQVMKAMITKPGENIGKLFVAQNPGDSYCSDVIYEFGKYHHKIDISSGKPDDTQFEDKDNHRMDAIRYVLNTRYGKMRAQLMVASEKDRPLNAPGPNRSIAPTPSEFAQRMGIRGFVDNRDDFVEKDGVRVRKDKSTPNKDPRTGGSTDFSWSF